MRLGYTFNSIGTFTESGFATFLRTYAIFEKASIADTIAAWVSQGVSVNVMGGLIPESELLSKGVQYTALDIDEQADKYIVFSAVDFKVEDCIGATPLVLLPTKYVVMNTCTDRVLELEKLGLVRIFKGDFITMTYFSEEFSSEFE